MTNKKSQKSVQCVNSSQWASENDNHQAGVAWINKHAPELDAMNEKTLWILLGIKEGSETPIPGWPEGKVRFMAQHKVLSLAAATLQYNLPLHRYSPTRYLSNTLLPTVYPLRLSFGLLKAKEFDLFT